MFFMLSNLFVPIVTGIEQSQNFLKFSDIIHEQHCLLWPWYVEESVWYNHNFLSRLIANLFQV